MTLNGRNSLIAEKMFYGAHQKYFNEDRPVLSAAQGAPNDIEFSKTEMDISFAISDSKALIIIQ